MSDGSGGGLEERGQDGPDGQVPHLGRHLEIAERDTLLLGGREVLAEADEQALHDLLGPLPIGIGQEEDHAFARQPENAVIDAEGAADVVHHLGKHEVSLDSGHPDHHRREVVGGGKDGGLVDQLAQPARVVAPGSIQRHCIHHHLVIDETSA